MFTLIKVKIKQPQAQTMLSRAPSWTDMCLCCCWSWTQRGEDRDGQRALGAGKEEAGARPPASQARSCLFVSGLCRAGDEGPGRAQGGPALAALVETEGNIVLDAGERSQWKRRMKCPFHCGPCGEVPSRLLLNLSRELALRHSGSHPVQAGQAGSWGHASWSLKLRCHSLNSLGKTWGSRSVGVQGAIQGSEREPRREHRTASEGTSFHAGCSRTKGHTPAPRKGRALEFHGELSGSGDRRGGSENNGPHSPGLSSFGPPGSVTQTLWAAAGEADAVV